MKDRFFSIVSHDLRGPLGAFNRLTEAMVNEIDTLKPEEIKEVLDSVRKSADQLYKLLENLLDWARTQLGNKEFLPKQLNLAERLKDTVSILSTQAQLKDISLRINIADEAIEVLADPDMVSTIFRNLISNAIKFTPRGGTIDISAARPDSQFVSIAVTDTGIGMDADTIANLFKVGRTRSHNGTENENGTGLGLVLCKDFVEKHGGTISVVSERNVGTTFSFTLPLA